MRRPGLSAFVVAALLSATLVGSINVAPARAAIACTSSSGGYVSQALTVGWTPPPRPSWRVTGRLWTKSCSDGAGESQWLEGRSWVTRSEAGSSGPVYYNQAVSSIRLATVFGDDCSNWNSYGPATLFNTHVHSHSAGWHWQPAFTCGFRAIYNDNNKAWGTVTQNNVFSWDWSLHN